MLDAIWNAKEDLGHPSLIHKDIEGATPLHIAASKSNDAAVKYLVFKGQKEGMQAQIDNRMDGGETALMKAAEKGSVSISQFLIEKGANVLIFDNSNNRADKYAERNGHT